MQVSFTVIGPPQPKQRARRGKDGDWYTPKRTVRYERAVRGAALGHFRRSWPLDGNYRVSVAAFMPDEIRRDADNVLKSVKDALNGIAWHDDSQVIEATCSKALDRDNPRTVIYIETIGG